MDAAFFNLGNCYSHRRQFDEVLTQMQDKPVGSQRDTRWRLRNQHMLWLRARIDPHLKSAKKWLNRLCDRTNVSIKKNLFFNVKNKSRNVSLLDYVQNHYNKKVAFNKSDKYDFLKRPACLRKENLYVALDYQLYRNKKYLRCY